MAVDIDGGKTSSTSNIKPISSHEGRTDLANARRLVRLHGNRLRYCHPWRRWLVWNESHWQPDESGMAERLAKDVADETWQEAQECGSEAALKWAAMTASSKGIRNLLSLASTEPGVPVSPDELDRDPLLLNCLNGTLDFKTGLLRQPQQSELLTKIAPVEYHPDSTCPLWMRFLDTTFSQNSELISYVQRLSGSYLTGLIRDQVVTIAHGLGDNGKSTFFNALLALLGDDYGMTAPKGLLTGGISHSTEMADLRGKRLVVCAETSEKSELDESLVKMLSGGERIRARRCFKDSSEFDPTHKLVMQSNHFPRVTGTDHGIWRRICVLPFLHRIPKNLKDGELPEKLTHELAGILRWCVEGCLEWLKDGLQPPHCVIKASEEYRAEQDTVSGFIECDCEDGEDHTVKLSVLHVGLKRYCQSNGIDEVPNEKKLTKELKRRGYVSRSSNGTWYNGIALKEPVLPKGLQPPLTQKATLRVPA